MSEWKNININKNNIKGESGAAVLIGMPKSSQFKGYDFWHPAKCVRDSHCNGFVSVGYTDEWEFKLKKYGKGKYNEYDVIDEITATAEDIELAFMNMNDHACSFKEYKLNPYETHKPEKEEVKEVKILDELKDE